MPRVGSKSNDKKQRSLDTGLWLVTAEGTYIPVEKDLIKSAKIIPEPAIRYGKPYKDGQPVELVENARWPTFRDDLIERIKEVFQGAGFTADKMFPKTENATQRFTSFLTATLQAAAKFPIASYQEGKVDRKLEAVDKWEVYQVVGVNETGREILKPFPYLEMTHQIHERTADGRIMVWPSIYYDLWLPEKIYELSALDDAGLFELWKLDQKLSHYPFPKKDEAGNPVLENGQPVYIYDEGMLVKEGYVSQSGSKQQYHALIVSKRIKAQGEDRFVLEMKLSKTPVKYSCAMRVPKEGEVPMIVSREQRPLVMESFAELLATVTA